MSTMDEGAATQAAAARLAQAESRLRDALTIEPVHRTTIIADLPVTRSRAVALDELSSVPQTFQSQRRPNLLGGAIAGLMTNLAITYRRHLRHCYFRTPDEIYQFLDVPVLASLPAGIE